MHVLLSPAKTMDFEKTIPYDKHTIPMFLNETEKLVQILKKLTPKQLEELMEISPDLAKLNAERYQKWKTPFTNKNARPCIFTFDGPVYRGFDFIAYKDKDYERLQNTVRILSGLHGLLKPFDLIQPYRLDMHIPIKNQAGKDLYTLWKEKITDQLNKECTILVNCASQEYSDAVDWKKLTCKVINTVFKDYKNGKYVVVGITAKKARGMYADFVVRNNIQKIEDLKKFSRGYSFDPKSSKEQEFVFLRKKQ